MKSLYKLLFICILAFVAMSAGQFALYRINEQHTEIRSQYEYKDRAEELESLYKYTPPQKLPNLRVNERMSPGLKNAIEQMEKQQSW